MLRMVYFLIISTKSAHSEPVLWMLKKKKKKKKEKKKKKKKKKK